MKNVINYYYGIIVNEFKKRDNSFIFIINDIEFEFIQYYDDINKLLNIYSILKNYRRNSHDIIINKNNNFITYYENNPYILLKKIKYSKKNIELDDILEYDCNIYIREELNWKKMWKDKIDYYEFQIGENGLKYPLLKQSFGYYLGLSEIAINLLNYVNYKNITYCISHKRIEKIDNLYNPINMIIDNKSRDIAEYIKLKFFSNDIKLEEITNTINKKIFTKDEILLFLARLIYPSYYFDIYEKIYKNKEFEKDLNKIIKKNVEYETFLKQIYNQIKLLYVIPQIEFLEY